MSLILIGVIKAIPALDSNMARLVASKVLSVAT